MTSTIIFLCMSLLSMPKVGDIAPDFQAVDTSGQTVSLKQLVQTGYVVLAFFPKAFTSGCTQELRDYESRMAALNEYHAQVIAISYDESEKLAQFKAALKASYRFVADPKRKIIDLYDVRQFPLGMAKRTTFVINKQQVITRIDTGGDAMNPNAVLDFLKPMP